MEKIFDETTAMRSHYCGSVIGENVEEKVKLCGWVHKRRDLGGLIFVDLRDRTGLVQIVFDPDKKDLFKKAEQIRHEYVVQVEGVVKSRPEGMKNKNLMTGAVEIHIDNMTILNKAKTLPFPIEEYVPVGEESRLKYRYLDLRRPEMFERLYMRAQVAFAIREFLTAKGFIEVETPMMTKATPEGARDYLVPSRVHPGEFYALPQSPQLFKQLLMIAGFDRYFQLPKCMRDEDFRADRQMEFTQLDIEMTFVDEKDIQDLAEGVMQYVFQNVLNVDLEPFPRVTYAEAIRRFGCDKPDLRNPLELFDVADLVKNTEFKVFSQAANDLRGRVAAICVPNGATLSRKQVDEYGAFASKYGAKGLAIIKVNDIDAGIAGLQSSILKFLPENVVLEILQRVDAKSGDMIFFCADKAKIVNDSMSALRNKFGKDFKLIAEGWAFLWVTDFPMFELTEKGFTPLHHPFTAAHTDDINEIEKDPEAALSRAYDMVLNGSELGSGSIRINNFEMQQEVFKLLGIDEKEAQEKFGFLLEAMQYGCPPHGGIALGLDRIVMLMAGVDSIRDIIAFPKSAKAQCLLTSAPSPVTKEQLEELHIRIDD